MVVAGLSHTPAATLHSCPASQPHSSTSFFPHLLNVLTTSPSLTPFAAWITHIVLDFIPILRLSLSSVIGGIEISILLQ